jgi:hypothetical protein
VLNGVIEFKKLKTKGLLAKKHIRFIQSCMTILNLDDAAQLEQRFGEQQMNARFVSPVCICFRQDTEEPTDEYRRTWLRI